MYGIVPTIGMVGMVPYLHAGSARRAHQKIHSLNTDTAGAGHRNGPMIRRPITQYYYDVVS